MTCIQVITNFLALTLSWIFVRLWFAKATNDGTARTETLGESMTKETLLLTTASSNVATSEQSVLPSVEQSSIYSGLVRGLREKDETIDVLHRRLAFLNGEVKLKDLRIANLVGQVSNFVAIGLQRTRPYVTGSKQPRLKTKMPTNYF